MKFAVTLEAEMVTEADAGENVQPLFVGATVYVPAASSIKSSLYWPMVSLIPYGITGPFRARWGLLGW